MGGKVPFNNIKTGHFRMEPKSFIYKTDLRYSAESDETFPAISALPIRTPACRYAETFSVEGWLN